MRSLVIWSSNTSKMLPIQLIANWADFKLRKTPNDIIVGSIEVWAKPKEVNFKIKLKENVNNFSGLNSLKTSAMVVEDAMEPENRICSLIF